MKEKLSFTERFLLQFVLEDIENNGGVSRLKNREIANLLQMSERQVVRYLKKLQQLNFVDIIWIKKNKREIRKGGIN